MIACIVDDIQEDRIKIEDENFTHLNSALRVSLGDKILLLDGKGRQKITTVDEINKKNLFLTGGNVEESTRRANIDVLLSPPKRDALNDCLRLSCELGIRRIYLYETEYTQNRKVDEKRNLKILKSSIIQSNNPFLPEIINIKELGQLPTDYNASIAFHLSEDCVDKIELKTKDEDYLLVIGPEGGFSDNDIKSFREELPNFKITRLETPIMRTPTALCAATAWVLSKI